MNCSRGIVYCLILNMDRILGQLARGISHTSVVSIDYSLLPQPAYGTWPGAECQEKLKDFIHSDKPWLMDEGWGERDFSPCLLVADEKYGVYYLITVFKPSWSFLLDIFSMILQRTIYTIHIGLNKIWLMAN